MPPQGIPPVIPAQLSFLTIFNPSLGKTDETLQDQIVFYYSTPSQDETPNDVTANDLPSKGPSEEENRRLRQVGLAQGMVSFAKNFAGGESVDSIETENSRLVLRELEPGWWILASVHLTKIFSCQKGPKNAKNVTLDDVKVEYTSREMSPPYILTQQLSKANAIFLMHHGSSLDELYSSLPRKTFCVYLERFWTQFAWNWDILLSGNPAIDLFSGIKLAGGGELGIGVGEEEWGSGEREVIEGFIARTEGLVDMVVSRFGDAPKIPLESKASAKNEPGKPNLSSSRPVWTGGVTAPGPQDGVIFCGTGSLSRNSLSRVSQWMEWIYRYGEDAYGMRDDPRSVRRRKRKKRINEQPESINHKPSPAAKSPSPVSQNQLPLRDDEFAPQIPPPLITAAYRKPSGDASSSPKESRTANTKATDTTFGTNNIMNIITLGYGSTWNNKPAATTSETSPNPQSSNADRKQNNQSPIPAQVPIESANAQRANLAQQLDASPGNFIIGLRDSLEDDENDSDSLDDEQTQKSYSIEVTAPGKPRSPKGITVRTLELTMQSSPQVSESFRVVIYLHQPFMFLFLFKPRTTVLSSTSFYRSIHHQVGPLQKSLLLSTSPSRVADKLSRCNIYQNKASAGQALYDIIYDPLQQTIRTSLPNIPESDTDTDHIRAYNNPKDVSQQPPWSRPDSLNVYMQMINIYVETRLRPSELERICKTSRDWWVLWMRIPAATTTRVAVATSSNSENNSFNCVRPSAATGNPLEDPESYERAERQSTLSSNVAFLVRKASDSKQSTRGRFQGSGGPSFFRNIGGGFGKGLEEWSAAPGKLAEGVGLDAKKYIDALINLNR